MTLRASVVDTLSLWNSTDPLNKEDSDFLFVQFLSIEIFGGRTLALRQLDDQKLNFVKEIFAYRVKNDERRLTSFKGHVDKITEQLSNKLMAADNGYSTRDGF